MNARRRLGLLVCLPLVACATRPLDPFVDAERALVRHDLARALQALDAVPVAHAQYPKARAAAVDVERDMRRCHELILEAMLMRSEWRDSEALLALQKVQTIWPGMPGVDVLIQATEQRRRLFEAQPRPEPAPLAEVAPTTPEVSTAAAGAESTPAPVPELPGISEPQSSAVAVPSTTSTCSPAREPSATVAPTPPPSVPAFDVPLAPDAAPAAVPNPAPPAVAAVAAADDAVAIGLVAVEVRLGRGQLEVAVNDLLELARRFPADPRVRGRLVRLLHQRALLRYGDGNVALAVSDWQRVLELDAGNRAARRMLDEATREAR